ncbi:MAG: hypothetical protein HY892_04275 [Deltaproteobacteria bacterium]|nr:hypothetical protein [Deltaproteobacteria bacterium]
MTAYELLAQHIADLQALLQANRDLLTGARGGAEEPVSDPCLSTCRHQRLLRKTLLETIQELEASRKAFKSKQLEALRKKLTAILAEIA